MSLGLDPNWDLERSAAQGMLSGAGLDLGASVVPQIIAGLQRYFRSSHSEHIIIRQEESMSAGKKALLQEDPL